MRKFASTLFACSIPFDIIENRMNKKFVGISILGIILSFIGGFMLANALNRSETGKLQAENTKLQKERVQSQESRTGSDLSTEEIQKKIAEAERNPDDFAYQKGLGLALYRYAAVKRDNKLLEQVTGLLERAYRINPDDYDVLVSLGNIYYDLGQSKKDADLNLKARDFYKKALEKNSKDANVRTDYGLTFLLTEKPERELAIRELKTALELNPKNEKALVYMTQAQIGQGNFDEAGKYLIRLKEVNPENPRTGELEALISQNK